MEVLREQVYLISFIDMLNRDFNYSHKPLSQLHWKVARFKIGSNIEEAAPVKNLCDGEAMHIVFSKKCASVELQDEKKLIPTSILAYGHVS